MQTTINQPTQKQQKRRQEEAYPDYPITVVSRKKNISKSAIMFGAVLCLMGAVITMSVENGNLFLKELVVSSLIVLMIMFIKSKEQDFNKPKS